MYCLSCDYCLRGIEANGSTSLSCPECGRLYDPANPNTFGDEPQLQRTTWWMWNPALWLAVVFWLLIIALVVVREVMK